MQHPPLARQARVQGVVIVEAIIQGIWTADFRKLESAYAGRTFKVGALFVPLPELLTLLLSLILAFGIGILPKTKEEHI